MKLKLKNPIIWLMIGPYILIFMVSVFEISTLRANIEKLETGMIIEMVHVNKRIHNHEHIDGKVVTNGYTVKSISVVPSKNERTCDVVDTIKHCYKN